MAVYNLLLNFIEVLTLSMFVYYWYCFSNKKVEYLLSMSLS